MTSESPETLHASQYAGTAAEPFARAFGAWGGDKSEPVAARLVPTITLQRLAELARVVRDPSNGAPLTELLDLLGEVTS